MMITFTPMATTGGNKGNYYYGARYYNPQVSVWLSVDPMSSRDPGLTPYHYVKNNPVNLIDPTGLTWDTPEDQKTADKMSQSMTDRRTEMQSQLATVEEKLSSTDLSKKERGTLMSEKSQLGQGIQEMTAGIGELNEMGETKDMSFHFRAHLKGDGGIEAYRSSKDETGISSITIGYKFGDGGNKVHETKHAYDLWKNEFGDYTPQWSGRSLKTKSFNFQMTGTGSSQYYFEYAAYKRQYHFSPSTSPVGYSQLNMKDIKALRPNIYKW
jgi:RHS repeat-associated protein